MISNTWFIVELSEPRVVTRKTRKHNNKPKRIFMEFDVYLCTYNTTGIGTLSLILMDIYRFIRG